jgi:hypothetical protein
MNEITAQVQAAQRIAAISWVERDDRLESHSMLFKEYLRRSALWFRAVVGDKRADDKRILERLRRRTGSLHSNDEASDELRSWPFLNLALRVAPEAAHIDDRARMLLQESLTHSALRYNRLASMVCRWYVSWAGIESAGLTSKYQLNAPYEPLIRLYERGGDFRTDHGDYRVCYVITIMGAPINVYLHDDGLTDLSDAALDALDER